MLPQTHGSETYTLILLDAPKESCILSLGSWDPRVPSPEILACIEASQTPFRKAVLSRFSAAIPIWQLARGSEIVQLPFHLQGRLAMLDNFLRVTSRARGKDEGEDSLLLLHT